ncbi:MAG: hypothetical protein N2B06_16870 [Clostridium sp.]
MTYYRTKNEHSFYKSKGDKWLLVVKKNSHSCKKQLYRLGQYTDYFKILEVKDAMETFHIKKPKYVPCWVDLETRELKYGIKYIYEL